MSVSVEKKPFGVTRDGEAVSAYCIKNEALAVEIMEYGAAIRSLRVHHGARGRTQSLAMIRFGNTRKTTAISARALDASATVSAARPSR